MKHLRIMTLFLVAAGLCLVGLTSCGTIHKATSVGADIAAATGVISTNHAGSIKRSTKAVAKSLESITPEQEYYIGRAVAATIAGRYEIYENRESTQYINLLGQALAQASDRPETFAGYHFLIMDSDEVNAFAAPGGFIFVSRGMLRLCENEDAVAAVLAHEIGHVAGQHGLKAIKKGRLSSALTILASESAKTFGGQDLAQLTEVFEGSVNDITGTMINRGYARGLESEADEDAVVILKRVGYDPNALLSVLKNMGNELKPGGKDFAKTHPDPSDRIADVQGMVGGYKATAAPGTRLKRFQRALGKI